jgi:ABC-2 type transport system permease protein
MRKRSVLMSSLFQQVAAEARLFWRSRQAVYLNFFVPMLGMALFVYLHREGLLERFFGFLFRGLGAGIQAETVSPIVIVTIGLITYCIITAAFEGPAPQLVRLRDAGILKRLGGTPLRVGVLLTARTASAGLLVFIETALILVVGAVSTDVVVRGSWWALAGLLLLATLMVSALGFILSNLTRSPDGAVVAVHAVYIPMLLLCGAFYPVEAMPKTLQVAAQALPLTYFVRPFRSIAVEGAGLLAHGVDLLILLAWTIGAWAVAVVTFRWE